MTPWVVWALGLLIAALAVCGVWLAVEVRGVASDTDEARADAADALDWVRKIALHLDNAGPPQTGKHGFDDAWTTTKEVERR